MLEMAASLVEGDAPLAKDRRFVEDIVSQTKRDGYASSVGGSAGGISAIALPIQGGGPVIGSLNLIACAFPPRLNKVLMVTVWSSLILRNVRTIKERTMKLTVVASCFAFTFDHNKWISYSHWGMFPVRRKSSNSRGDA
jgi:hypothetical protein